MDLDVQQRYLDAEQAYGEGDFAQAESIASTLLAHLEESSSAEEAEEEVRLAWRAFVTLLLGHIHFHGLNQPEQGLTHYKLALDSQPPDTLRDLAEQGVERCEARIASIDVEPDPAPESNTEPSTDPETDPSAQQDTEQAQDPSAQQGTEQAQDPNADQAQDPGLSLTNDPFLDSAAATAAATTTAATPAITPEVVDTTATIVSTTSATPWLSNNEADATSLSDASPVSKLADSAPTFAQADPALKPIAVATDDNSAQPNALNDVDDKAARQAVMEEVVPAAPEAEKPKIDLTPWLLRSTIALNKD
ncbi:MAG: hypothetical protein ACON4T_04980 [Synechococcus sp.]